MQISLGHFLFSVLLSTGASFQCGSCREDQTTTCRPTQKTCGANEENCMTALDEVNLNGDSTHNIVEMNCTTREICKNLVIQLVFGTGHYLTKSTTCCQTDGCTPPSPKIPQLSTITNGKSCPACHSLDSTCVKEETLNCTGSNTFCFSFYTSPDKIAKKGQIKGCTTESVCTALKTYGGPLVGFDFVRDVTCQKAKGSALEFHLLSLMLTTLSLLSLH